MNRIPADLLEAFVCVAESKNLFEAAAKLNITQPTLSRQLKILEEKFSTPLFNYRGRNKVLTLFGESLHQSIKDRFSGLTDFVGQVSAHFSDPANAKLRIAGRREVLGPFISKLKFSGSLQFSFLTGESVLEALESRSADICITQRLPDSTSVVAKPLFKRGFVLAVPKKFSSTKPKLSSVQNLLRKTPCLSFSMDLHSISELLCYLKMGSTELKLARICGDWSILQELAENSVGWALLPRVEELNEKKMWLIDIPNEIIAKTQFYLLYQRELGSIRWFQDFLNSFKP